MKLFNKRLVFLSLILGFIYTLAYKMSVQLNTYSSVNLKMLLLPTLIVTPLAAAIIGAAWVLLRILEDKLKNNKHSKVMSSLCEKPYLITIILFICWLPCFLSDFPGGFRHDAYTEFSQAEMNLYNPAFPLLHSVIITRFLPFMYNIFGSYNVGIATYVIVQMILIAILYTYIIRTFYHRGVHSILLWIILLYMALFPTIHMLVEFSGRDMLFTGLLVYTLFTIYELITDKDNFWSNLKKPIILAVILPLTVYSRNNSSGTGFLIVYLIIIGLIVLLNIKGNIKKCIIFAVCSIALYIALGTGLGALCQPTFSNNKTERESLGFYAQTLSRAFTVDWQNWTQEEMDELCKYCDPGLLTLYNPLLSDYARASLFVSPETRDDFKAFWWRIGKKHASTYFDAYLLNSQPAWDINSTLYGYVKTRPEGYYGKEKQYFSINPESEEQPAVHVDLLPTVSKFYQHIAHDISFEKIPVVSFIFSIAYHLWFSLFAVFYLIYRKERGLLLPALVVFLLGAVCTFVPIVLVRYFAFLFFATPILFIFVTSPQKCSNVD